MEFYLLGETQDETVDEKNNDQRWKMLMWRLDEVRSRLSYGCLEDKSDVCVEYRGHVKSLSSIKQDNVAHELR